MLIFSQWLTSLGSIILNCLFLANFYQFDEIVTWIGVGFLAFAFMSNLGFSIYLSRSSSKIDKVANTLAFFASLIDVSPFYCVDKDMQFKVEVSSFRLGNVFYQTLPMIVLQAYSLSTVSPIISLVTIAMNIFHVTGGGGGRGLHRLSSTTFKGEDKRERN